MMAEQEPQRGTIIKQCCSAASPVDISQQKVRKDWHSTLSSVEQALMLCLGGKGISQVPHRGPIFFFGRRRYASSFRFRSSIVLHIYQTSQDRHRT